MSPPDGETFTVRAPAPVAAFAKVSPRSEEHTSELQSLRHLVCRLLLEKKKVGRILRRPPLPARPALHPSRCLLRKRGAPRRIDGRLRGATQRDAPGRPSQGGPSDPSAS